jgi:hypothetical protein
MNVGSSSGVLSFGRSARMALDGGNGVKFFGANIDPAHVFIGITGWRHGVARLRT